MARKSKTSKKVEKEAVVDAVDAVEVVAEVAEVTPEFKGEDRGYFYAARGNKKEGFVLVNQVGQVIESGLSEEVAHNKANRSNNLSGLHAKN